MNGINWKDHGVNLFVVILGISIAFYLEHWREERSNENLESQYLAALADDLEKDRAMLDTLIVIDEQRNVMLSKLAAASIGRYPHVDSLGWFLANVQFVVRFAPQKASFAAMTASGKIEIISDFGMRSRIFEVYNQWFPGISQFDEATIQHINQFMRPFSINEVEHISATEVKPDFLGKTSFRNMIFSYQSLFQYRLHYYKQALAKVESLIQELEGEL